MASKKTKPSRLGRGLSALLSDQPAASTAVSSAPVEAGDGDAAPAGPKRTAPIAFLIPNPKQPRKHFDETALSELAASIKKNGLLQPILVRPISDNRYEIVAGERRWRAAQRAGLHEAPVVVRELGDAEVLQLAIIENVQREDLNPLEEAESYKKLIDEFGHSQEDVADVVGKSRSHISNLIRLLKLPETVRALVADGALSMGHARAVLTADDPEGLSRRIVKEGLSVRDAERLAKAGGATTAGSSGKAAAPTAAGHKDADTRALERDLAAALGLDVSVNHRGEAGDVVITYKTLDQLDEVCRRLCG